MCIKSLGRVKGRVQSWWQRSGEKALPDWYFTHTVVLLMPLSAIIFSGSLVYGLLWTVIEYAITHQIGEQILSHVEVFLVLLIVSTLTVAISGAVVTTMLYLRKRTKYTFRNKHKTRKIILQRDSWTVLCLLGFGVSFALASVLGMSMLLLFLGSKILLTDPIRYLCSEALSLLTLGFQHYFPLFCVLVFSSINLGLLLSLDLGMREILTSIIDSLVESTEQQNIKRGKEWIRARENMGYFTDKLLAAIGRLYPFERHIMKELDFSYLKPLILAMHVGNVEEKKKAEQTLLELQDALKENAHNMQNNVVNWLSRVKKDEFRDFPRLKELADTIKMDLTVGRGFLYTKAERIDLMDTFAKFIVSLITIAGGISALVFLIWNWVTAT